MKITKITSLISALFILFFTNVACNSSDDDSGLTYESLFNYEHDGITQPIKDFYAFVDQDSQLIISTFSAKIPVEGIEDQIEDIYTKRNLTLTLSKFEEGRFAFDNNEVSMRIDTLFYAYDSQPYKTSSLSPKIDSLDNVNSFVYIKDIKGGLDLVSGNFRLHRIYLEGIIAPVELLKYKVEGDFQHIPFTTYN